MTHQIRATKFIPTAITACRIFALQQGREMSENQKLLEQQLARAATAFANRKGSPNVCSRQMMWKICGLTGLTPAARDFHGKAANVLCRMLSAQRRWARMKHPAYDLNRHLAIREALDALRGRRKMADSANRPDSPEGYPAQ